MQYDEVRFTPASLPSFFMRPSVSERIQVKVWSDNQLLERERERTLVWHLRILRFCNLGAGAKTTFGTNYSRAS